MPDLNMFGLRVLNWILGDEDGTGVFAADGSLSEFVAIIKELVLNPQHLSTTATIGYIFGLSG